MSDSKIRFYLRTASGLRRVSIAAVNEKRTYPQMANARDMAGFQVIFTVEGRYNVHAGPVDADEKGILDFAPDTNTFRMCREAAFAFLNPGGGQFVEERAKQLRNQEQIKYGLNADERKILEADLFGKKAIPFLKLER